MNQDPETSTYEIDILPPPNPLDRFRCRNQMSKIEYRFWAAANLHNFSAIAAKDNKIDNSSGVRCQQIRFFVSVLHFAICFIITNSAGSDKEFPYSRLLLIPW